MSKQGDDFYLLRLAVQTGPRMKELEKHTAGDVLERLNSFVEDAQMEKLLINWLKDAAESMTFFELTMREQKKYLDTLGELTHRANNPRLAARAADVKQVILGKQSALFPQMVTQPLPADFSMGTAAEDFALRPSGRFQPCKNPFLPPAYLPAHQQAPRQGPSGAINAFDPYYNRGR